MLLCRINSTVSLLIIAVVSVNCLRIVRPIIQHDMRKDRYDADRKAAVAELTCDYSKLQYCFVSCSQCHAVWSGVHQGKKVNVSESAEHIVWTNASECATHMEVMWTVTSELHSYYDCKVTADYRHKKKTFLSNPHHLEIKIRFVAATENVTAERGSNLNLFCPSKVDVPPKNLSDARCIWWKNGTRVPTTSEKYQHSYRQILTIFNVSDSDAGSYECKRKGKGITKSAVERSVVTVTVVNEFSDPPTVQLKANESTNLSTEVALSDLINTTKAPVTVPIMCIVNGTTVYRYESIERDLTKIQMSIIGENVICSHSNPLGTTSSTITQDQSEDNQRSGVIIIIIIVMAIVAFIIVLVFVVAYGRKPQSGSLDTRAQALEARIKNLEGVAGEILDDMGAENKLGQQNPVAEEINEHEETAEDVLTTEENESNKEQPEVHCFPVRADSE